MRRSAVSAELTRQVEKSTPAAYEPYEPLHSPLAFPHSTPQFLVSDDASDADHAMGLLFDPLLASSPSDSSGLPLTSRSLSRVGVSMFATGSLHLENPLSSRVMIRLGPLTLVLRSIRVNFTLRGHARAVPRRCSVTHIRPFSR